MRRPPLGQEAPLPPVTIADLLRAALRHRPDRILVGEVRGAEAFDLLQALNTGHLGSLSTIHANSAEQALTRLAHCVLTANVGLPHRSIREAIGLADSPCRAHRANWRTPSRDTEIAAVRGYDVQSDRFLLESRLLDQPAPQRSACHDETPLRQLPVVLLFLPLIACGDGGSAPTSPTPTQSFLVGTWRGTMTIQPDPTGAATWSPGQRDRDLDLRGGAADKSAVFPHHHPLRRTAGCRSP